MQESSATTKVLTIERQESLATEKFSRNGSASKDLHLVAKAIAFTIHVASTLDLHACPLNGKLIYDRDQNHEGKEVEMLKGSPLEFTAHVNDSGDKAAVETKISVLSSQHEGAYFRVKFWVTDPTTKTIHEELSNPIKVISKRNQVRKMLEKKQQAVRDDNHQIVPDTISFPLKRTATAPTTATDASLAEAVQRLEQQSRDQMKMIQELVMTSRHGRPFAQAPPPPTDFDAAFRQFLNAYNKVPTEERSNKVRRVVNDISATEAANLAQFFNIIGADEDMSPNMSSLSASDMNMLPEGLPINSLHSSPYSGDFLDSSDLTSTDEQFYSDFLEEMGSSPMLSYQ